MAERIKVLVNSVLNHDGRVFNVGEQAELPLETAKHLESVKIQAKGSLGVVTILPTIVEPVENPAEVNGETVPDPAPQEAQAEAEEETPKATKKTSKRRIDSDDE